MSTDLHRAFDPVAAAALLVVVAALGLFAFAALYTWKSAWRSSAIGRNTFYFYWALVLAYLVGVARAHWPGAGWPDYARAVTLALIAVIVWRQVFLLINALRRRDPADADQNEWATRLHKEERGD